MLVQTLMLTLLTLFSFSSSFNKFQPNLFRVSKKRDINMVLNGSSREMVSICLWSSASSGSDKRSSNARLTLSSLASTKESNILDSFVEAKLDSIRRTFEALTERLSDPDLANDRKQMLIISRERSSIEPTVLAYSEWRKLEDERLGLIEIEQDSSSDQDMKEMCRQVIT